MKLRGKRKNRYRRQSRTATVRRRATAVLGLLALAGVIMAFSTMLVYAYQVVVESNYLALRKISIMGNHHLSRRQVMEAAGLKPGLNLLSINLTLVRKQLLANPWIAAARVSRQVPDSLQVTVREHRPMAMVELGARYLLNRRGEIFKRWQPGDPENLPLVTGLDMTDIGVGQSPGSPVMQAVRQALLCALRTKHLPLAAIAKVQVDKQIGITISAYNTGVKIRLGFNDFDKNYKRLARLISYLKQNGRWSRLRAIDLTDANRMVVKFSGA